MPKLHYCHLQCKDQYLSNLYFEYFSIDDFIDFDDFLKGILISSDTIQQSQVYFNHF